MDAATEVALRERMTSVFKPYVELGKAYLDEAEPGWRDKINVDTLDIALGDRCILGQLDGESCGNYLDEHSIDPEECGFMIGVPQLHEASKIYKDVMESHLYPILTEVWKRELALAV